MFELNIGFESDFAYQRSDGADLAGDESDDVLAWVAEGCHPTSMNGTERTLMIVSGPRMFGLYCMWQIVRLPWVGGSDSFC